MSRRVYALWRSARTCSRGCCLAKRSSWGGLAEAFISRPQLPALKRAQRGCMFSTHEETAEKANPTRGEEDPVNDNAEDSVICFIESYFAVNQKYPTIALVALKSGRSRKKAKQILDYVKGRCAVDAHTDSYESASYLDSMDSMCLTSDDMSKDSIAHDTESQSLAAIIGSDTAEGFLDGIDKEDMCSFADIIRGSGNSDASNEELLDWLGPSSSKEKAIKKTAPLIEVLQQTASSSRRVHLSAWRGVEKDLSWDNTLRSIMPSPIENKQQDFCSDGRSINTLSASTEAGECSTSTCPRAAEIEEVSTSADEGGEAHTASKSQYRVKLISTTRATVLSTISSEDLVEHLKSTSKAFLHLQDNVQRIAQRGVAIHAILFFETKEGMMDALHLKTLKIGGEIVHIESVTEAGEGKEDAVVCNGEIPICSPYLFQHAITIEDFPESIPLQHIEDFFSVFGKVQIHERDYANRKRTAFLIFQNECDKKKALRVQQFALGGWNFHIRTGINSKRLTIQLVSKQDKADTTTAINTCRKYGTVARVRVSKLGVLFAVYSESERYSAQRILDSLSQDKDLEGIWEPTVVFEGYRRYLHAKLSKEDVVGVQLNTLWVLTNELSKHVKKMCSEAPHDPN